MSEKLFDITIYSTLEEVVKYPHFVSATLESKNFSPIYKIEMEVVDGEGLSLYRTFNDNIIPNRRYMFYLPKEITCQH